jgi:hypothetical protein
VDHKLVETRPKVLRGVGSLIDLPGDEDGGMFGLRRALELPLTPAEKLARALLHAPVAEKAAKCRRGRPDSKWRKVLPPFVAQIMRTAPRFSGRQIAEHLLEDAEGPQLGRKQNISRKTIENMLTVSRKLAQTGEPLDVDIKALEALWPDLVGPSPRS